MKRSNRKKNPAVREKMVIHQFQPGDAGAVIDLWKRCGLIVPCNDPHKDIARKLSEDPTLFFISEIDNSLVAVCMAGYDGHRGWIYYLAVAPEYQRQVLATEIVEHAETGLKAQGCPKVELMVRDINQPVIEFYQRLGYKLDPVVTLGKRLIPDDKGNQPGKVD